MRPGRKSPSLRAGEPKERCSIRRKGIFGQGGRTGQVLHRCPGLPAARPSSSTSPVSASDGSDAVTMTEESDW